jgi:hypothetical protein
MSFPRLPLIILPLVLGLPLLVGACAGPTLAVAAASYGGNAASVAETGKTTTDHYASIVTKKDCALWRMFKNQDVCRDRDMTHDVYHVSYDSPFRQQSEGGTEYLTPPHYNAGAPATSWDVAAYSQPTQPAATPTAQPPEAPAPQGGGTNNQPPAQSAAVAQPNPPHPAAPPKKKHAKKTKPPVAPTTAPTSTAAAPTPPSQGQVAASR